MLIVACGHTVVYGTWRGGVGFSLFRKNSSFGHLYSNVDFLIIMKKFGRVGSYAIQVKSETPPKNILKMDDISHPH